MNQPYARYRLIEVVWDERETELFLNTVHAASDDIRIEFGIKKCGVLTMKKGKVMTC